MIESLKRIAEYGFQRRKQTTSKGQPRPTSTVRKALDWITNNELEGGGIRVHSKHQRAYPEVSGYLIPTLLENGMDKLATRILRWLLAIQRGNGGYPEPDHANLMVFDSAQVLRGLLCYCQAKGVIEAIELVTDYIAKEALDHGRKGFGQRYDGTIPETVHLYALAPLRQAARMLGKKQLLSVADNLLGYYITHPDLGRKQSLTHYLGYEIEGLIECGQDRQALSILNEISKHQRSDGSIPAKAGVEWVCTPGVAQLALCWYKLGIHDKADACMNWLDSVQEQSGGFLGSYGNRASYFASEEISWAVKFYLDAHKHRIIHAMEDFTSLAPDEISSNDGRVAEILKRLDHCSKILEIGCGKGRLLRAIHRVHPKIELYGLDISSKILSLLPSYVIPLLGSAERIPLPDDSMDLAFAVETLEHSPFIEAAVREMVRVTRPGGWVMIVDKEISGWGRFPCPAWESWPGLKDLLTLLRRYCDCTDCYPVSYDNHGADGLMWVWLGQKRTKMGASEWHAAMVKQPQKRLHVIEEVAFNRLSEWAQEIILSTARGEKVLEVGGGTGAISLALAQAGRHVTIIDFSPDNLLFIEQCARDLGVAVSLVLADATKPLPFQTSSFDCVWSSGLLEHFNFSERIYMLKEWSRVSRDRLINLVPNAFSLPYRLGKAQMEKEGKWNYGIENPLRSLKDEYEQAGLVFIEERVLGVQQALKFLDEKHFLHRELTGANHREMMEVLEDAGQGYLLIAKGKKRSG